MLDPLRSVSSDLSRDLVVWDVTSQIVDVPTVRRHKLSSTAVTVELDEGVRMNAPLRATAPHAVRIGMPVRIVFERVRDDLTLPAFVSDPPRRSPQNEGPPHMTL
jgi:DUF35 OB-fold domain, acyl-CoA-associated